jgi:hypothetical protein
LDSSSYLGCGFPSPLKIDPSSPNPHLFGGHGLQTSEGADLFAVYHTYLHPTTYPISIYISSLALSWVYGLVLARFWRVGCRRKQKRLITKVPPLVAIFRFDLHVSIHIPYRVIWPRLNWRELRWLWTLRRLRTVFLLRRALILGPSVQTVQSYQHAAFG